MSNKRQETIADIAAQMRGLADGMEKRGLYDLRECGTDYLRALADLIEAAADAMEKSLEQHDNERRGKKYEYGVRIDGNKIDCDRDYIFESEQYARRVAGDYLQVVCREVGEWEEIKDDK